MSMTPKDLSKALRERGDDMRLVVYHDCQGEARPTVALRFALGPPDRSYACPLCLAQPGPEGFTYETAFDEQVHPDIPRKLTETSPSPSQPLDPCRTFEVHLLLQCVVCSTMMSFFSPTRKDVVAQARAHGWSLPPGDLAWCPEHRPPTRAPRRPA